MEHDGSIHTVACRHIIYILSLVSYDKDSRDNEGRTPLQLGAELDRTEAVHFFLSLKPNRSPSGCDVHDNSGHPALTSMIINMPQVVCYIVLNPDVSVISGIDRLRPAA